MTLSDIAFSAEEQARITALTEASRVKEVERVTQEKLAEEKSTGIDYYHIAQELLHAGDLLSFNGTVYRYKDGIYIEDKGQLESQIQTILQYRGIGAKERVTTATTQVRHYILYDSPCMEYPFNLSTTAIPLDNGVLVLDFASGGVRLVDHSPQFRFNYKLKVKYDPAADTEPVTKYLKSLGVNKDLLLQIPGHALLSMLGRVYKRAYFLKGGRDSGKSTYIRLITHNLFGPSVCANISLHDILFARFRLAELDGKIINAYADLADSKIGNLGLFKALTGGDAVTVEKKQRDPYSLVNKAVFLFSANRYPKIKGGDDAWWSRWIAINFKMSFDRVPDFETETFTDGFVSGLLLLVIERMKAIMKSQDLITTTDVEQDWLTDASSGYAFIRDCLERCRGAVLIKKDLYARYIEYCNDAEFEKESQKDLTELLKQHGAIDAYPKVGGRQEHCYQGFKIKDLDPVYPAGYKKDSEENNQNLNILNFTTEQRREKAPNMQDMQGNSILTRVGEDSTGHICVTSCHKAAYPAYSGMSRAELLQIIEECKPDDPPRPDEFRAAWTAADGV